MMYSKFLCLVFITRHMHQVVGFPLFSFVLKINFMRYIDIKVIEIKGKFISCIRHLQTEGQYRIENLMVYFLLKKILSPHKVLRLEPVLLTFGKLWIDIKVCFIVTSSKYFENKLAKIHLEECKQFIFLSVLLRIYLSLVSTLFFI